MAVLILQPILCASPAISVGLFVALWAFCYLCSAKYLKNHTLSIMKRNFTLAAMLLTMMAAQAAHINLPTASPGTSIVPLSTLDLSNVTVGWGTLKANKSIDGNTLTINDDTYESGLGVHANSKVIVRLNDATHFRCLAGMDAESPNKPYHSIVDYRVVLVKADGTREVAKEGTAKLGDEAVKIDMNVQGYQFLVLEANAGANDWGDHFDWANAHFVVKAGGTAPATAPSLAANLIVLPTAPAGQEIVPLSSLDLKHIENGWNKVQKNKSIEGNVLSVAGKTYASGVGVHARSRAVVKLNGAVTRFVCVAGIDDETETKVPPRVKFTVALRGENGHEMVVKESEAFRGQEFPIDVDVNGWKYLILEVHPLETSENDHFDWAHAYFVYQEQNSTRPALVDPTILDNPLACATTTFSQPGVRYMHKVRLNRETAQATATDLPPGLSWNAKRKLVEGKVAAEGNYTYNIVVTEGKEKTVQPISLTVSSRLPQPTPFMGWLSWNVIEGDVSNKVIETVADHMVKQGIRDAGYNYLVIDDLWHADARHPNKRPKEHPVKFPKGMKAAADYVHSKGLKFGIYSDAAPRTCAGAFGSYGYEEIDAKQYAEWEVDLLKYDYCHAPADRETAKVRYKAMGDALKNSGRDILFYMCEWGVREPWKWGAETGATTWRATYDTRDCWTGVNGGIGVLESIKGMKDIWAYSGVNRFNDADMMCVGINGKGKSSSDLVPGGRGNAGMTKDEYRTQFALWCMWSSPLTLSFDMTKPLSKEDLAIITNKELIGINQDRMGQQAELVSENNQFIIFAKDLENGDVAISATNLGATVASVTFDFSKIAALEPSATYYLNDLWNAKDKGDVAVKGSHTVRVNSHATVVYRLSTRPSRLSSLRADNAASSTLSYDLAGRPLAADASGIHVGQKGKYIIR